MYCRKCGKELNENSLFCSDCGTPIKVVEQKQSSQQGNNLPKGRRWKKMIVPAVLVLFIVSAIILICFLFQKSPEEKVSTNLNTILAEEKELLEPEAVGTKIAELIFDNFSFEVVSANHKEATIIVSSPNIYSLYMSAIQEKNDLVPNNQEDYTELVNSLLDSVYEELSKGNYDVMVSEVTVQLNDDYNIELSYELIDAIYGGLLSLQKDLVNAYAGGVAE